MFNIEKKAINPLEKIFRNSAEAASGYRNKLNNNVCLYNFLLQAAIRARIMPVGIFLQAHNACRTSFGWYFVWDTLIILTEEYTNGGTSTKLLIY